MLLEDKKPPIALHPPGDPQTRVRAVSITMLRQSRRLLWRSRGLVYSALASLFVFSLLLSANSDGGHRVIPWTVDVSGTAMGVDASGGLLRKPKGNRKPTSKDYDDNRARWLFSKEWNETGT